MILTKQLQVVIQSSLAQGRDYEEIRDILMKQGFQDADISELFSQYRGANPAPASTQPVSASTPSTLESVSVSKSDFVPVGFDNAPPKKDFVPVGYSTPQKDLSMKNSAQDYLKGDVQKFMNVGTNTQTASDLLMKAESKPNLPAPGTTLLPSEMNTAVSTPKVINESGLAEGEVAPAPVAFIPTKVQAQQYINVGFAGMPEMEKVLEEEKVKNIEKSPWPLVFVLLFLLVLLGGFIYWFLFINADDTSSDVLDQLIVPEAETPVAPPAPVGPLDPFTNLPIEQ